MIRAVLAGAFVLVLAGCGVRGPARSGESLACGLAQAQIGAFAAMPEGSFVMGASPVYPEEGPAMHVRVAPFMLQIHEVTNGQFNQFVAATGYLTDAERSAAARDDDGGSAVFSRDTHEWLLVRDATWRAPDGAGSSISGLDLFPVVHVSHRDAQAYAAWAGGRLPSEVEWEYAASLQLPDGADQKSSAYDARGRPVANTWQGLFPIGDEGVDGFRGAAPVGCFPPGQTGLYDMIGNVWEWTETPYGAGPQFTIKGGSFLCAKNFCGRFRPAARQPQDEDFSTNHIGFRIARDMATAR